MRADQRFRMADVEPAARLELLGEALDQLRLGRPVEIDHHVAAEDRVEQALERPRLHQVELAEGDQRAHVVVDATMALRPFAGVEKEP